MQKAEKRKWRTFAFCVLLVVLVFAAVSFFVPLYPEICSKSENSGKEECAAHYITTFVLLSVGEFLEAHDGAIVATATIFIAWFTFQLRSATVGLKDSTDKLWSAGETQIALIGRQTDLAEKQHGLAREEFFASHRPRISVTRMSVQQSPNAPLKINFIFVNNGEAEAKECLWNAGILLLEELGAIHGIFDYSQNVRGKFKGPLAVGMAANADVVDKINLDPRDYDDILAKRKFLHVIGAITYDDNNEVTRSMGFLRCYDAGRRRFRVVDDPEYEYQD